MKPPYVSHRTLYLPNTYFFFFLAGLGELEELELLEEELELE